MAIMTLPRALLSLFSLAILAAGAYFLWRWFHGVAYIDVDGLSRHRHGPAGWLYAGIGLVAWSFLGRFLVLALMPRGSHAPTGSDEPGRTVAAPDGASLRLHTVGPTGGPILVFTHGWGLDSSAWRHARSALSARYRVVTWDLPGLGGSRLAPDGKITIDRFAAALGAVIEASGEGPVVLVGHSIGGMVTQTLWRACPAAITERVAGVVLVHTTYQNPLRTMWLAELWRVLSWPLIEPMFWTTIALSPLVWLSSWQGYLSGSSHLAMRLTGFGRFPTRGDVDLTARLAAKGSPSVQAKGNLAMFRWRVDEELPAITAPTLVLCGSRDIVTLPAASRRIADTLPNGRLQQIEGTGHMGFLERAEVYETAITKFMADLSGGNADAPMPNTALLAN